MLPARTNRVMYKERRLRSLCRRSDNPICPRHPGCKAFLLREVIRRQAACLFSWESHPRAFIMARPRITEVSLSSASVIAASGSSPDFAYKFYRSPHIEGRGAPTPWLDLPVDAGNVPDEMDIQLSKIVFEGIMSSHFFIGTKKSILV